MIKKMIVEQRAKDIYRNVFDCRGRDFHVSEHKSLLYERNYCGVYGWIVGYGEPPSKHIDVFGLLEGDYELGDELDIKIIGIFIRNDKDNKIIGVQVDRLEDDFFELSIKEINMMKNIYPKIRDGEGWFGKEKAIEYLRMFN